VIRRSITVDDRNNKDINELRAAFIKHDMELDFTRAVNMLMALAIRRIVKDDLSPEENKIIDKYVHGAHDLEIAAMDDEQWNKWLEYEYPKMVKRLNQLDRERTKRAEGLHKGEKGAVQAGQ
jgi:hypothetical protein